MAFRRSGVRIPLSPRTAREPNGFRVFLIFSLEFCKGIRYTVSKYSDEDSSASRMKEESYGRDFIKTAGSGGYRRRKDPAGAGRVSGRPSGDQENGQAAGQGQKIR